jgi:hypothetical protein
MQIVHLNFVGFALWVLTSTPGTKLGMGQFEIRKLVAGNALWKNEKFHPTLSGVDCILLLQAAGIASPLFIFEGALFLGYSM